MNIFLKYGRSSPFKTLKPHSFPTAKIFLQITKLKAFKISSVYYSKSGMGKKGRVKSNPHSKIDPIMPGH